MEILGGWLLAAAIAALIASAKGRSGFLWFLVGLLLPVIAIVITAILPVVKDTSAADRQREQEADSWWTTRKCPSCAERIKREAKKCRFCGSAV